MKIEEELLPPLFHTVRRGLPYNERQLLFYSPFSAMNTAKSTQRLE